MGTDIHIAGEVYNRDTGTWHAIWLERPEGYGYWPRDYRSFGKLADVRNGTGFAGVSTGSKMVPISYPKGFPKDWDKYNHWEHPNRAAITLVTEENDDEYNDGRYWFGDHSFSWLTLEEIKKAYNPDEVFMITGMVSPEQKAKIDAGEKPEQWCGWTNRNDYTQVSWPSTVGESCFLLTYLYETLIEEATKRGLEDDEIRIVFGFDS